MTQEVVNVLMLQTKGKARVSERAGTISLKADNPICALQEIARQANLNIVLTPEEMARISGAGKLPISLSYANNRPLARPKCQIKSELLQFMA